MSLLFSALPDHMMLGDHRVGLKVSRHYNARRMTLRYDAGRRQIRLTMPPRAPARLALAFLEEKQDWLTRQMLAVPAHQPFTDGMELPILGKTYTLKHIAATRGRVELQKYTLKVTCLPEHLDSRLTHWLKHAVREQLLAEVDAMAKKLKVTFKQVRVRDMSSRWGSCNAQGNLSFNWRLVFAPPSVLTYLVAHEVAHLKEMNHSAAFWSIVAKLDSHYEQSRTWLKRHGSELHRYGFGDC